MDIATASEVLGQSKPKKPTKPKAKKKTKPKPKKKTAKKSTAKKPKTKKSNAAKSKRRKPAGDKVERSERLDMRLSVAEKARVVAKAKKLRRTVTSLVIEAIEKIK